jgi:hypothetical protein
MKNLLMMICLVMGLVGTSRVAHAEYIDEVKLQMQMQKALAETRRTEAWEDNVVAGNKRVDAKTKKGLAINIFLGQGENDTENTIAALTSIMEDLDSTATATELQGDAYTNTSLNQWNTAVSEESWGAWYESMGWISWAEANYLAAKNAYELSGGNALAAEEKYEECLPEWQALYDYALAICVERGYQP